MLFELRNQLQGGAPLELELEHLKLTTYHMEMELNFFQTNILRKKEIKTGEFGILPAS